MNNKKNSCSEQLINMVLKTIRRGNLIPDGSRVLVAVSGGADSVCLLHVLCSLRREHGYKIFAAHLNHGIRGAEADSDEEYVKSLCDALKVKLFAGRRDIPSEAKDSGMTEEEAGRFARYEFFRRVCDDNKIDITVTAHNKNDQAETLIMRMVRGSGLSGLRGIKYKREDGVVRPLLDVSRDVIEEYCIENGLEYRTDSTNSDNSYTRNKVRHTVIPALREINPSVIDTLSKLAQSLGDDADFIDGYVRRLYSRMGAPIMKKSFKALDIESLNLIDNRTVLSRLIIMCARDTMGDGYTLERKHVDLVLDFAFSESTGGLDLPGGLTAVKNSGWLEFRNESSADASKDNILCEKGLHLYNNSEFCIEVQPNKLYNIKSGDFNYKIELCLLPAEKYKKRRGDMALDYDMILDGRDKTKLILRNRRNGDKISVYKNGKRRKIKRLFIDLKINRSERGSIPLLCDGENVLAAVGVRAGEKYKMTESTKNVLVIYCDREEHQN